MAMIAHLNRCAQISQSILALCGGPLPSCPAQPPAPTTDVLAVETLSRNGIAPILDSKLPAALAKNLHEATQTHFRRACQDLLARPRPSGAPSLKLALDLKATFTEMYRQKVVSAVAMLSSRLQFQEKQPYATDILLYAFEQSQTPSKRERAQLSKLTGMTLEQVRVWFQNRRQRMKKRAPEVQPRSVLHLDDVLARVAAYRKAADEDFEDNDSGYCSGSDRATQHIPRVPTALTSPSTGARSYPAPYKPAELSSEFYCEPPLFSRTAAVHPPAYTQTTSISELAHLMSRLTLRHRRQTPRSSTGSTASTSVVGKAARPSAKGGRAAATTSSSATTVCDTSARKKVARKDPETGRRVAGRRTASATTTAPSPSSVPSPTAYPPTASSSPPPTTDTSAKPRKRLGPLRRKPAGKALARQASESSVGSTSSSDSSRSTSYSSDFSLASDSSFTSVESAPTAATMECFQPQQPLQFDPLAAFDFTQLFSSQPSDPLPQPVADFELPPDLLAGLQMPMDTAALPPPESTDFLALLNDPTIQDLLQSVQDMDVVAPQQAEQSFTFDNTLDVGSVDTSAFLDLSASTLPTFDAMFGLDASSFQDTLWNSPGFSLPITV